MVIMFVISYSRTRVVRTAYSAGELSSLVMRSPEEVKVLETEGQHGYIVELQGFLFFGTANVLLEQVKTRLKNPSQKRLVYLQIDFGHVTGIDSSIVLSFQKMSRLMDDSGVTLVFSNASPEILHRLQLGLPGGLNVPGVKVFSSLDYGLEWIENQILAEYALRHPAPIPELPVQLPSEYYDIMELDAGETFIHKGDPADCLYFLVSGQVSVYRQPEDFGRNIRARTMGPGNMIGEIAIYTGMPRTALVITDVPSRMIRITRASLDRLDIEAPHLSSAFHQAIIQNLIVRILQEDRSMAALRR